VNVANCGPVAEGARLYGACRPGHLGADTDAWADVLAAAGVERVVCLLSAGEARRWGLPAAYADRFEVAHVPVRDRHLPDPDRLERALAAVGGGTTAVHCNAGLGRTGVVGAAWLVRERGFTPRAAVEAVGSAPAPRAPLEAVREGTATEADLYELLGSV